MWIDLSGSVIKAFAEPWALQRPSGTRSADGSDSLRTSVGSRSAYSLWGAPRKEYVGENGEDVPREDRHVTLHGHVQL